MTRMRKGETPPPWWRGQMTIGNAVNLLAILGLAVTFYFNTNHTLENHGKAIASHDIEIKGFKSVLDKIETDNRTDRDKMRAEVIERAERTATGIADLNKRQAVAEVQLVSINNELVKIGRFLENVLLARPRADVGGNPIR